eukprot:9024630-Karenia_brevis.AAC.1
MDERRQKELQHDTNIVELTMKVVAATLRLFPRIEHQRLPREKIPARQPGIRWHEWVECGEDWRCLTCLTISKATDERNLVGCPGTPVALRRVLGRGYGHNIHLAERHQHQGGTGAANLYYCTTCGAWATRTARHLAAPCTGAAKMGTYGYRCLEAIKKGLVPQSMARIDAQKCSINDSETRPDVKKAAKTRPLAPSAGSRLEAVHKRVKARLGAGGGQQRRELMQAHFPELGQQG